ncbi:hypothetical protein PRECH8_24630 [Insulibacter thermoxylanivorax]|uniref:Glycosyl transferase family 2 n=2 Tax=Insulibacter thermoxylanivorax TaxID=2749268 RepID=A0A916QEB5_9BACL|nr:hypothetical protein PRECH8_24630 [Insulibacter thermoxylanivorax]
MMEGVLIIIACYLLSAVMVHAVYRRKQRQRRAAHHYVLVTRNNEPFAELAVRAITWHARLCGKDYRISVIDEGSKDQTLSIIRRLDRSGNLQVIRTRNWVETGRFVREYQRASKARVARAARSEVHSEARADVRERCEEITVIHMNRPEDRAKIPLFGC